MFALLILAFGIFIIDFLIYGLLLYMGYWYVVPVMIVIIIIVQTLRYYDTDIFQYDCVHFASWYNIQFHLDDSEWVKHMFDIKTYWQEEKSHTSRNGAYALLYAPHTCTSQPSILYSPDRRHRALVYHNTWRYNFLFQKHTFTIRYEMVT